MAITIHQQPQDLTPAYNEQVILVSSDNTGFNNFKYVFKIYEEDGTTPLVNQYFKLPPRPSDNRCVFDVKRIIENYVTHDIAIPVGTTNAFKSAVNSFKRYVVSVGEEFDVSSSGVTTYPDQIATSGVITAFNAIMRYDEFSTYDKSVFEIKGDTLTISNARFLTNSGTVVSGLRYNRIRLGENAWLYGIRNNNNAAMRMSVGTLTKSGSVEGYFHIANHMTTLSDGRYIYCECGTRNIGLIPVGAITTAIGSTPIIKPTTAAYFIQWQNNSGALPHTEFIYFLIEDLPIVGTPIPLNPCTKEATRLHFLNTLGGIDSFTFTRKNSEGVSVERKKYKKVYGTQSGTSWGYTNAERGNTHYDTQVKRKIQLISGWITEQESEWLTELIASPQVWIDENNELKAVNVITESYKIMKSNYDKLFNIEIELEYSFSEFRQRY